MKKLTLEVESLKVESFATGAQAALAGTTDTTTIAGGPTGTTTVLSNISNCLC